MHYPLAALYPGRGFLCVCRRWVYPQQGGGCWDVGWLLLVYPCLGSAHANQLLTCCSLFFFWWYTFCSACWEGCHRSARQALEKAEAESFFHTKAMECGTDWIQRAGEIGGCVGGLWVVLKTFPAVPHTKSPLWSVLSRQIQNRICCRRASRLANT